MAGADDQIFVGPSGYTADGQSTPLRGTRDSMQAIVTGHADCFEAVLNGNCYEASNQAAQAVSVALATTYTGIMLSNPLLSNTVAILWFAGYALSVAPAAIASLHLIGGWSGGTNVTHTAAITAENCLMGSTKTPVMKVDSQATIPTPTYKWSLEHGFTAAALPSHAMPPFEAKGMFVLMPGAFIGIGALTAVTGFGSLMWEEVPLSALRV